MKTRHSNPERKALMDAVGPICRWPYDDKWGGTGITEGSARAQAHYAAQMYDAAMHGKLNDFLPLPNGAQQ